MRNKNVRLKRICVLLLTVLLLAAAVSLASVSALAMGQIEQVVPFTVEGEPGTVRIEAENSAPLPSQSALDEGEGNFTFSLDEPGQFEYRVRQESGANEDYYYDDTQYDLFVFVEVKTDDGQESLVPTVVISAGDPSHKPDKLSFQNGLKSIETEIRDNTESLKITSSNFNKELALRLLSEEELAQYNKGTPVLFYLTIDRVEASAVPPEDREIHEKLAADQNETVAVYLDIRLYKKIGESDPVQIHNTEGNPIAFSLQVPTEYQKKDRTYYMLRSHDGEGAMLAQTTKTELSFSTDRFSIYSLGYSDVKYTVSFLDGDGTVLQTSQVPAGETPTYSGETPTKAADKQYTYTFKEWSPALAPATADVTYQPVFDKTTNKYDVNFDSNGGSTVAKQTIEYGKTATKPSDPTRSGYTFDGWYQDKTLSTPFDFSTPITDSVTLYAKWTVKSTTSSDSDSSSTGTKTTTTKSTGTSTGSTTGTNTVTYVGSYSGPKTGDERLTWLWITLIAAAVVGIVGLTVTDEKGPFGKKKNSKRA